MSERKLVECRCIAANVRAVFERTWYTPGYGYSVDYKIGTLITRDRALAISLISGGQR